MREMRRKYAFIGKLELKSAMHIGGGDINLRGTDSPIVLTPEGDPFIPGSSLKGVFRSTVEKLVGAIPNQTTCSLFEGTCPTADQDNFNNRRRNGNWGEAKLARILNDELCDTCKLFGSPFSASKIFFSDLYVDEWAEATQVRHGVAIDRDSERARDQHLYDYEVASVGSTFKMEIILEDPSDTDLRLACVSLNEFVSGMGGIGGMRSRGLGNCQVIDLVGYESDLTNLEQLKKYLVGKKLEEKMSVINGMDGFLEKHIEALLSESA